MPPGRRRRGRACALSPALGDVSASRRVPAVTPASRVAPAGPRAPPCPQPPCRREISAAPMAAELRRSRFGRSLSERWRRSASGETVERIWFKLRQQTLQGTLVSRSIAVFVFLLDRWRCLCLVFHKNRMEIFPTTNFFFLDGVYCIQCSSIIFITFKLN